MKRKYNVGIVGIGAVGTQMVKVLRDRNFPVNELRVMARSERYEKIAGERVHVIPASAEAFDGLDFAFFAGTEGAKGASQVYGWDAAKKGVVVIDNGGDYRMDPRVPLVVPEVNGAVLKKKHANFIANPNCSTIIALMALGPLHKAIGIKRFVVSTYQSVSGTGQNAINELDQQARDFAKGKKLKAEAYPYQIAFNVIPQIGGQKDDMPGYTTEEAKMLFETRKILGSKTIKVSATCVRVPVFYGHAESINIEFKRKTTPDEVRRILKKASGVKVMDDPEKNIYPIPLRTTETDDVEVGRIRFDDSVKNGIALFVCGNNIRKGAALNAVQIAEYMIKS